MRRRTLLRSAAVAATTGVAGVSTGSGSRGGRATTTEARQPEQFSITIPAWENGEAVPTEHTCDGEDASPRIEIESPPAETRSLALVVEDPDAPNPPFVHWLLWNVPADARAIPADDPRHTYLFDLYAMASPLDLEPGATYDEVLASLFPGAVARARYVGQYERE